MKILFTGKNHSQGLKISDSSSLAGVAQSLGNELVESLRDSPEVLICVDFHKSALQSIREAKSKGITSVLIANEPEVVIPEHSQDRVLKEFDRVLMVGRPGVAPQLKWPQTWMPISRSEGRLDRVALVNADKWSFIKGQHYWLRAAASAKLRNVDVFGFGWDRPLVVRLAHRCFELWRTFSSRAVPNFRGITKILAKPGTYKGSTSNKHMAMCDYKVALVIENSSEFLSEKLFDAWFAGCIPVYVGPPVESFGIPSGLVVQVENPTLRDVRASIDIALGANREEFLNKLEGFLASGVDAEWSANAAIQSILFEATKPL